MGYENERICVSYFISIPYALSSGLKIQPRIKLLEVFGVDLLHPESRVRKIPSQARNDIGKKNTVEIVSTRPFSLYKG